MRIVKEAPHVADWQFTCSLCQTVLEASESDIRKQNKTVQDQRGGPYTVTSFYVECPVCGHRTDVKVPLGWPALHKDMKPT